MLIIKSKVILNSGAEIPTNCVAICKNSDASNIDHFTTKEIIDEQGNNTTTKVYDGYILFRFNFFASKEALEKGQACILPLKDQTGVDPYNIIPEIKRNLTIEELQSFNPMTTPDVMAKEILDEYFDEIIIEA